MATRREFQPELFFPDAEPVESPKRPRKKGTTKKVKKKIKGLQYKIQFWKGLKGTRTRKFHTVTFEEHSNLEDWRKVDLDQMAIQLLERTLEELAYAERNGSSSKVAEIVAWIERRFDDASPFNFELCARLSGCDPDELREKLMARIESVHGTTFPHYQVLRTGVIDAEAGDPDAILWVLSESTGPLSFVDCCKSLGFEPSKARKEIHLPVQKVPSAKANLEVEIPQPLAVAA